MSTPLPTEARRHRCQQCGRKILPTSAGRLAAHRGGPGDGRPEDGRCYGTGQPVQLSEVTR